MDPNEVLRKLLAECKLVRDVTEARDDSAPPDAADLCDLTETAESMAELFQSLHDWLVKGGFTPTAWGESC